MNNIPNHRDDPQVPSNLKKSWLTLSNVPNEYSKDDVKLHEELPSEGLIKCWVAQVHLKCDKKRLITVKSISDCATVKELQAFRSLLNTIHNLPKHRNCVEILGVTTTEVPYYVYQEFVENGNLRDSLLRNFQETGDNQQCNDKQEQRDSMQLLTQYSIQVADGMSFLAENKVLYQIENIQFVITLYACFVLP
ncbi:Fibroblast growth factor receptor 2 [Holothuria leucospilota]|uniref:Fibroblast growth factor receptor 2 n=1 Tax=Holothuria leucospilota TaxID=206669 RepID=A0A9Q1B992_HOLLE|nr:Fibroblast growth factor receptor 2 [Holothuria leucospilota]